MGVQEIFAGDADVLATDKQLIWCRHVFIENIHGDIGEIGMSNPGAIMTSVDFAELIRFNFIHCRSVGGGIIFDGDLSCHATLMLI
jgi:hypothetical protein